MMIGNKRALDVASVVQGDIKFFSVLMLTWGKWNSQLKAKIS
jgi:hypothetical protein